ncbi:hypothetical protein J6590_051291 [Homalodisca vitripennis]|nr:hypothetical protein J6590_051291 [Homalodisca vitripennis]
MFGKTSVGATLASRRQNQCKSRDVKLRGLSNSDKLLLQTSIYTGGLIGLLFEIVGWGGREWAACRPGMAISGENHVITFVDVEEEWGVGRVQGGAEMAEVCSDCSLLRPLEKLIMKRKVGKKNVQKQTQQSCRVLLSDNDKLLLQRSPVSSGLFALFSPGLVEDNSNNNFPLENDGRVI